MARTKGSLNTDHEKIRDDIVQSVKRWLMETGGSRASYRDLCAAAGKSPGTVRHYYLSRQELISAAIVELHRDGLPFIAAAATQVQDDVRVSLGWLLASLLRGWKMGVGRVHEIGLAAGLGDSVLGPAYVREILEPTLQAAEARLSRHVAQGQLQPCDLRFAALELLSPVVLAMLHQQELFGKECRPLDINAFVESHLERFLRAHQAPSN